MPEQGLHYLYHACMLKHKKAEKDLTARGLFFAGYLCETWMWGWSWFTSTGYHQAGNLSQSRATQVAIIIISIQWNWILFMCVFCSFSSRKLARIRVTSPNLNCCVRNHNIINDRLVVKIDRRLTKFWFQIWVHGMLAQWIGDGTDY